MAVSRGPSERLFFALLPDSETRSQLQVVADDVRKRLPVPGRAVSSERYHLTLHFLGDYERLPSGLIDRAVTVAKSIRAEPFNLIIDRAATFANPRSVPMWLGPAAPVPALRTLWRELRDALRANSVPYDAGLRLTPHITVGYNCQPIGAPLAVMATTWKIRGFSLVHSRLGAQPAYSILGDWTLKPPPAKAIVQRDLWDT